MSLFKKNKINVYLDIIFISLINLSILYFFYTDLTIGFECDAATNFMYGKSIYNFFVNGSSLGYGSYRGPLYPILLILSGTYLFNSFNGILIFHILISLLTPIFTYLTFKNYNRFFGILSALIIIISLVHLVYIKLILSINLAVFLLSIVFYFIYNFFFNKNIISYYLASFFLVLLTFTRWEFIFLQIIFFTTLNLKLFLDRDTIKLFYKRFFISVIILISPLFIYISVNNKHLIKQKQYKEFLLSYTSINHKSGAQLLWKFALSTENNLARINGKKSNNSSIKNYLLVENGENTKKLYNDLLLIFENLNDKTKNHLKLIKNTISPITTMEKNKKGSELYNEYYGNFLDKGNSKGLIENIFKENNLNHHYILHLPSFMELNFGKYYTNKILSKVAFEIFYSNKNLRDLIFLELNYSLGRFNKPFSNYFENKKFEPSDNRITKIKYNLGILPWMKTSFNGGKCPENVLSKSHFQKYKESYYSILNNNSEFNITNLSLPIRNFMRDYFGFFVSWFIFLFFLSNRKIMNFSILSSYLIIITFITLFGGHVNTKYEAFTFLILIYLSLNIFIETYYLVKKFYLYLR